MAMKWSPLALVLLVSASLLTGCTNYKLIKSDVQQSLAKKAEINSYRFTGSAELKLDSRLLNSANPLTQTILSMLKDSITDWEGIVNTTDHAQYEANIKVTPSGAASGIEIPLLFKDNKLYFHMPAINKDDEYYSLDVKPEDMQKTSGTLDSFMNTLIEGLDAKWFVKSKESIQLGNNQKAHSYSIDITPKNEKDISTHVQSILPSFLDSMKSAGLLPADRTEKMKAGIGKSIAIHAPGKISFDVDDDQGYVISQTLELHFSFTAEDGSVSENQIVVRQTFSDINGEPSFNNEIPTNVKPFEDVLQLLNKTK